MALGGVCDCAQWEALVQRPHWHRQDLFHGPQQSHADLHQLKSDLIGRTKLNYFSMPDPQSEDVPAAPAPTRGHPSLPSAVVNIPIHNTTAAVKSRSRAPGRTASWLGQKGPRNRALTVTGCSLDCFLCQRQAAACPAPSMTHCPWEALLNEDTLPCRPALAAAWQMRISSILHRAHCKDRALRLRPFFPSRRVWKHAWKLFLTGYIGVEKSYGPMLSACTPSLTLLSAFWLLWLLMQFKAPADEWFAEGVILC